MSGPVYSVNACVRLPLLHGTEWTEKTTGTAEVEHLQ